MEYIINEPAASQCAWLVGVVALGSVRLERGVKVLCKAWKTDRRLHVISYGDNRIDDYDEEYDD